MQKINATLMEKIKELATSQMSFFVIGPYAHLGNFRTTAGCLLKDCQVWVIVVTCNFPHFFHYGSIIFPTLNYISYWSYQLYQYYFAKNKLWARLSTFYKVVLMQSIKSIRDWKKKCQKECYFNGKKWGKLQEV